MQYRENKHTAGKNREEYLLGIERLIEHRESVCTEQRKQYADEIFTRPEKFRTELKKMLGYPLNEERPQKPPEAESELLAEESGYEIYRMNFKFFEDMTMSGLFFKRVGVGAKPLIIAQHGGMGTPELISGLYDGYSSNYNDMVKRLCAFDVNIFAPQLLLWRNDEFGDGFDRAALDARLKRIGSSIAAVELYGLMRIIDWFEEKNYVTSFGMVGLSYGGFYTLFLSAIDERIRSAVSCSFFNERKRYAWSDWTWNGAAEKFNDAEIACLIYPRRLCIELGTQDDLFDIKSGRREVQRLKAMSKEVGLDWFSFVEFDGCHEFCCDDEPLKKMIEDLL